MRLMNSVYCCVCNLIAFSNKRNVLTSCKKIHAIPSTYSNRTICYIMQVPLFMGMFSYFIMERFKMNIVACVHSYALAFISNVYILYIISLIYDHV